MPRILRMLERAGVTGSFFVPGLTADRYPGTVEAIVAAGHDLGHHGYSHVPYHDLSDDGERADVRARARKPRARSPAAGREGLPRAVVGADRLDARPARRVRLPLGLEPDGRRPPLPARHRPGILAELPVHWMLDDWEQYAFLPEPNIGAVIESPAKVLDLWTSELDALAAEGGLMILTSHPFLSGRASRVATLERVVEHARGGRRHLDRAARRDRRAHADGHRRDRRPAGAERPHRGGHL